MGDVGHRQGKCYQKKRVATSNMGGPRFQEFGVPLTRTYPLREKGGVRSPLAKATANQKGQGKKHRGEVKLGAV